MAEIRRGFAVHPPRGRSERVRPSMADFAFFFILLAFMAGFILLASFVRPGSVVWAWTIAIFAFLYTRIPFIYIHSVRLSLYERIVIGLITVIAWISFRCLFDREERFTAVLSYILISPELSGFVVRSLQLAAGLTLFLTSAALTRPLPPSYSPPSTTQTPPPVYHHSDLARVPPRLHKYDLPREPLLVPIRPLIFTPRPVPLPKPAPPVPKQVLSYTIEVPRVHCHTCSCYPPVAVRGGYIHTSSLQSHRVASRRPRVNLLWRTY